jgi:7-keto-8-aminopelargonate synthetase-like enzyme
LYKLNTDYNRVLKAISHARELGIIQLETNSEYYDGRIVTIEGKDLLHFGNCSYVGLDTCEAIKLGSIEAITKYGNLFASSRQYIALGLNLELEELLNQITGYHTLVTQSTTLGSLSAIPVLASSKDLIVMDHQLHASVQNAAKLAQTQGTQVTMVRHSNMQALEDIIKKHQNHYKNIWYLADGLYSMLGDQCPIEQMYNLLERYSNFHCFVDDAHGMSWIGKHGKGSILNKSQLHPKMVLVMSLAKGFGCCGGVLVFSDQETLNIVKSLGTSLLYSGPIPTPVLGGCIASAKLHLTEEITVRQKALLERIKYFREKAYALNLPLMNHCLSPIFYFGGGSEDNAYFIVKNMLDSGFFTCICNYPLVPSKNAGIRLCLTTHLTFADIDNALTTLAGLFNALEYEGKLDKEKIFNDFKALQVVKGHHEYHQTCMVPC